MGESNETNEKVPFYAKHLFGTMIFSAIGIAIVLVFASMTLYYSSGASQLDLSSPSYVGIRDQIDNGDDFSEYSGIGDLNTSSVSEFRALYNEKVQKIKSVDIFGGDPLSPASLGISDEIIVPTEL